MHYILGDIEMKKILFAAIIIISAIASYSLTKPEKKQPLILYGNIDIRQVNSAFRVSGRLENMNFEEGDIVYKGDILATLDNKPYVNAQNQAKAKIEQAKAALENAKRINNRKQALCKTKNASQQDCDTAQANLDVAETALEDTILKSPADGIILIRITEPGTLLSAGVPVYTISLNNKMWARAYIKETDLGKVQIGTKVKIYTDSATKVYNGHVGFISSTAEFTPKTIETASLRTDLVYRLRIIVDDADNYLKHGMPITIKMAQ